MDAEALTSADAYNKFMKIETIQSDYINLSGSRGHRIPDRQGTSSVLIDM